MSCLKNHQFWDIWKKITIKINFYILFVSWLFNRIIKFYVELTKINRNII